MLKKMKNFNKLLVEEYFVITTLKDCLIGSSKTEYDRLYDSAVPVWVYTQKACVAMFLVPL